MVEEQTPYTSKLKFDLDPEMRADEATRVILAFLCGVMRHNEQGICDDSDVEHLHDYRVAVRRTRSALGQIRAVFPAETTLRYKEDFALVGRWTNDLRDMEICATWMSIWRQRRVTEPCCTSPCMTTSIRSLRICGRNGSRRTR